jgi:hypothetical protein
MSEDKLRSAGVQHPERIPDVVRAELDKLTEQELKVIVEAKRKISSVGPLDNIGILLF